MKVLSNPRLLRTPSTIHRLAFYTRCWTTYLPRRTRLYAELDGGPFSCRSPTIQGTRVHAMQPKEEIAEQITGEDVSEVQHKDARLEEVYEKLISLYRSRTREDWRALISLSSKWPEMSEGIFQRIEKKAELESDPDKKMDWLQFGKALFNVHREIERYKGIVDELLDSQRLEWDAIVAGHRGEMTPAFFEYLELLVTGESDSDRQESLRSMASALISMVEMYDQGMSDKRALDFAKDSILDILQVDSIEEVDRKVDELAQSGGLDGAFMLSVAKMYTSVKESPYTMEETKDVMYHLYLKAKEAASAMQPVEVRILKHLLTIEDPMILRQAIFDAFVPGEVISSSLDYLTTTPDELLRTIDAILTAYDTHKGKHTTLGETSRLMNPEVIQKLRKLEAYVRKEYT